MNWTLGLGRIVGFRFRHDEAMKWSHCRAVLDGVVRRQRMMDDTILRYGIARHEGGRYEPKYYVGECM